MTESFPVCWLQQARTFFLSAGIVRRAHDDWIQVPLQQLDEIIELLVVAAAVQEDLNLWADSVQFPRLDVY